jgi:hypothetical protein
MWKWIMKFFNKSVKEVVKEVKRVSGRFKVTRRVIKPRKIKEETSSFLKLEDK